MEVERVTLCFLFFFCARPRRRKTSFFFLPAFFRRFPSSPRLSRGEMKSECPVSFKACLFTFARTFFTYSEQNGKKETGGRDVINNKNERKKCV